MRVDLLQLVTIIANHLRCDCSKAVKAFSCQIKLLSPSLPQPHPYFYCEECKNDYLCDQAIRTEYDFDKEGNPISRKLCIKCSSVLLEKSWPQ